MPLHTTSPARAATKPAHADPSYFECTTRIDGRRAAWVNASGEVDLATSPRLERALDDAQTRATLVVLDLDELTFMDVSGVHAILEASIYARLAGNRLLVLRTPPQIQDLFDLTGAAGAIDSHSLGLCT